MSGLSTIPYPSPLPFAEMLWPPPDRTISDGGQWDTTVVSRFGPASSALPTGWVKSGVAPNCRMTRAHGAAGEIIVGAVRQASAALDGFPLTVPLTVGAWASSFRSPPMWRVWRYAWLMAFPVGNPTDASGAELIIGSNTDGGWVQQAANSGALGVVGDGAGGLVFFGKQGAGSWTTQAITLPNSLAELTKFEIQIISADGRGPASLALYVNDIQATLPANLSSWGAGTALPNMNNGTQANSNKWIFTVQGNDGVAFDTFITAVDAQVGTFTVTGAQV